MIVEWKLNVNEWNGMEWNEFQMGTKISISAQFNCSIDLHLFSALLFLFLFPNPELEGQEHYENHKTNSERVYIHKSQKE
jgi:hypothetical protein